MNTAEIIRKTTSLVSVTGKKLRRIGGTLWSILSFSLADEHVAPGYCLSIQLDSDGIAVAYGSRFLSRIKIRRTRHYPYKSVAVGRWQVRGYPSPESLASLIDLAIHDLKAEKADVTLIIPKAWVIMKSADFPLIVKENLSDVVSYELDRITPLRSEGAYYDYQIIGEKGDSLRIIVAAIRNELLEPYLKALVKGGIPVKSAIVSLSALAALSRYVHEGKEIIFLDVRTEGYEGGVIDGGCLTVSFTGSFSSETEPEQIRLLAAAINPFIDSLKQAGKTPQVFVSAKAGALTLLPESIQAPMKFFGETDLKLPILRRNGVMPYTALGGILASLRSELRGMNLLDKGVHKARKVSPALTISLLAALAALGLFYLAASLHLEEKKVEAVDREIAIRENDVKRIEALKKEAATLIQEINSVEQFKASRPMVLDLLRELTMILPKNTWLSHFRVTESGVEIEGYAASATDIIPKLEASRYFKKVEFVSPTFRDFRMNADRFSIKMEVDSMPAEQEKNAKKQ